MVARAVLVRGPAVVLAALLSTPLLLFAASSSAPDQPKAAPAWESVEMFAAMESGDIDVKLIAKSDRKAQIRIKNNTDRPLSVRLPEAFAGAPILAQPFPGFGVPNRNAAPNPKNNRNKNPNQTIGMGLGPMNGQGNPNPFGNNFANPFGANVGNNPGFGPRFNNVPAFEFGPVRQRGNVPGGNGFFNVAPEAEGKFQVEALCLEFGKPNPRSTVPYEVRKIETVSSDPALRELLKIFGQRRGQINHQAAQAAAWHLANQMSWEELSGKRMVHVNGARERLFTADEIQAAVKLVEQATEQTKRPSQPASQTLSRAR